MTWPFRSVFFLTDDAYKNSSLRQLLNSESRSHCRLRKLDILLTTYERQFTVQGYIRICSFYFTSEVFSHFLTPAPALVHPPANKYEGDQK